MPRPPPYDRVVSLGLLVLLAALGGLSLDRARRGRYDFHHFYLDARYVWEHARLNPAVSLGRSSEDRQLLFYLPVVPLILSPVSALGRSGAALVWAASQVAALGYSLRVLRGWVRRGSDQASEAATFGLVILLALPALIEAARFNQLSYFVLALLVAAFNALERGRSRRAGLFFGLAAVLKLLPAVFLPWLLLKRRWGAAATFAVTVVLVALVPPTVAFGLRETITYHRQWWEHNLRADSAAGLLDQRLPEHFLDHRNQSISQVLARLCWPEHRFRVSNQPLRLDRDTCTWLGHALTGALLVGLLIATRWPWQRLSAFQQRSEAAAYAIGMLVFSPLVRQYYLVWVIPALTLLAAAAGDARNVAGRRVALVGLAVWAAGMLAWAWPVARLLGVHLLMLLAIGGLLLWVGHAGPPRNDPRSSTAAAS